MFKESIQLNESATINQTDLIRYYSKRFMDRESLVDMIKRYLIYYNTKRAQRNLGVLTPYEKHEMYLAA